MKLINLTLHNFRQFYGKQKIDFATCQDKNVTLIYGENNGGKTTILNAFLWCLYGELTPNLDTREGLLNSYAKYQGDRTLSIEVRLHNDGTDYLVKRTKTTDDPQTGKLKVFRVNQGNHEVQAEPNTLINTFLPKDMIQYFFLQGEGEGNIRNQNDFSHIQQAISRVLGLTIAEQTIKHLNQIRQGYNREFERYDSTQEIESLNSEIESLELSISNTNDQLAEKKQKLELLYDKVKRCQDELMKFRDIKHALKREQQLKDQLNLLTRDLKQAISSKLALGSSLAIGSFGQKLANINLNQVGNTERLNRSDFLIDDRLIEQILAIKKCICGTDLTQNASASRMISELENNSVDWRWKQRWELITAKNTLLSRFPEVRSQALELLTRIDENQDRINGCYKEIKEIQNTLNTNSHKKIEDLERSRRSAESDIKKINAEIARLEHNSKSLKNDITERERAREKLQGTVNRAGILRKRIKAVDAIIELYQKTINTTKEGIEDIILSKMREFFSQVAFNGYTVMKDTSLPGRAFNWRIVDKDMRPVAVGQGYQTLLVLSFIVSLIQFSRDRVNSEAHLLTPGTIAPLVADSFLGEVSDDNGRELLKFIVKAVEQPIFLFSQRQMNENTMSEDFKSRIGKAYVLVQKTQLAESEFDGDHPTNLMFMNKSYEVVEFGADFNNNEVREIHSNE